MLDEAMQGSHYCSQCTPTFRISSLVHDLWPESSIVTAMHYESTMGDQASLVHDPLPESSVVTVMHNELNCLEHAVTKILTVNPPGAPAKSFLPDQAAACTLGQTSGYALVSLVQLGLFGV